MNIILLKNMMEGSSIQSAAPSLWTGKTLVAYGDSITAGYYATGNNGYINRLASAKGAGLTNHGVSGMQLQNTGCTTNTFNPSTISSKLNSDKYIFFAFGVNDYLTNLDNGANDASHFQTTLDGVVATALTKGWSAANIVIITPFWTFHGGYIGGSGSCTVTNAVTETRRQSFVDAAKAVSAVRSTICIDVYTMQKNLTNPTSYIYDQIHPNDAGHQVIANYLSSFL